VVGSNQKEVAKQTALKEAAKLMVGNNQKEVAKVTKPKRVQGLSLCPLKRWIGRRTRHVTKELIAPISSSGGSAIIGMILRKEPNCISNTKQPAARRRGRYLKLPLVMHRARQNGNLQMMAVVSRVANKAI
jgi:hypothetical protein